MKTIVQLMTGILPQVLREELIRIHPHTSQSRFAYDCEVALKDPRLAALEGALARRGYSRVPLGKESDLAKEYLITYIRYYDSADWDAAEYLEIFPETRVDNLGTSEEGRVQLPGLDLKPDRVQVAHAFYKQIVLPERWKVKLEDQRLRGVEFVQAEIYADHTGDSETIRRLREEEEDIPPYAGEPWWELRSKIELPPVSDTMTLVDPKEQPVPRGTRRWVFRRERPYNHQELHYRRSDVRNFPSFDLARTWEEWGGHPALVASKRFYHACRDLGLDMGWVPVRIDE